MDRSREIKLEPDVNVTLNDLRRGHEALDRFKKLEKELELRIVVLDFSVEMYESSACGPRFRLRRPARRSRWHNPLRLVSFRGRI